MPKTLDLQVYGAHGALGRFTATPFPDATLAQDGTILPLTDHGVRDGRLIWHATPALDVYAYAGLEKTKAALHAMSARCRSATATRSTTTPVATSRIRRRRPATATPRKSGNTRSAVYDTIFQGAYGTVKAGVQYSYNQRFAFAGVGGAPKTDDHIVMTQIRYYPF